MNKEQKMTTTYDIIGDVHGHQNKLEELLKKLGYDKQDGCWGKQGHQAVFVGDLIDKGPKPAEVLTTVKAMVEAGNAKMVIGNHELNWIQDAADHTDDVIAFLDATDRHHCRRRITSAFKYEPEKLFEIFHWLRSQPLFIEQTDLRVVHACWHEPDIQRLQTLEIESMCDKALAGYRDVYSDIYLAIDRLVAGCAHEFPPHLANEPVFRSERQRIQWWPDAKVAINPAEIKPVPTKKVSPDDKAPPIFFGHYAMVGNPDLLGKNIVGVDYSAAYGGALTAYRHIAGHPLNSQQFVT